MVKKGKIGVITLPLTNYNYGGVLQAYALHYYLENIGYKVVHLNRQYNTSTQILIKTKIARLLNYKLSKNENLNNSHFVKFIDSKLNLSKPFYNKKSIESFIDSNNIETLITGSDQVWRQDYAFNVYSDLYLDFNLVTKPVKLSYAASFGKDKLSSSLKKKEIQSFLNKFNAVSVRETAGIEICNTIGVDGVSSHVDPTMLLEIDVYKKLFDQSEKTLISGAEHLVSYVLDESKETTDFLDSVAKNNNLKRHFVGKKIDVKNAIKNNITVQPKDSIEQWLYSFYTAELIITDSFHGCVFSILFNKPFITIGNVNRGLSRFQTLLNLFNLEDRLVLNPDLNKIQSLIKTKIDYTKVNLILEEEREKSKQYFKNNLK